MSTSQQKLVNTANELLTKCLGQLQEEFANTGLAIITKASATCDGIRPENLAGPPTLFLETLDAFHQAVSSAPVELKRDLKSMAYGAEDLWALTTGYLNKLASANGDLPAVYIEITDRHTGRTVPITLPIMSFNLLAEDINKSLRKMKKVRKKIECG